ncbi:MAG: TldD/PmbA family protein [Elusimicrobia bacterium]|nr:TldD/PmbA family protein [Elusimicrobiota bacterium]
MEDLERLAEAALDWIGAQSKTIQAELYLARGQERGIELREGELDGIAHASSQGAGLRVFAEGRMGFACAGGLSLELIQGLYGKIMEQKRFLEPDPHKRLPQPQAASPDPVLSDSLWDEGLFQSELERLIPDLKEMESEARRFDKRIRSVPRAGYGESRGEVVIAGTGGAFAREKAGSTSIGLSVLSEDAGEVQIGSASQSDRAGGRLDFTKTARDGAWRATALLGAKKLLGGRRGVVFDPWVAGEFLDLVAGLLCADQVQRGKSLLAGKKGARVASSLVTFIDDPRRPGGLGSSLFDDEGYPTSRKVMIDKGVVMDYFYDSYTANREGRASNASAGRGSYRGLPGPGCSNFFLQAGSSSRQELIAGTRDGILVLDVMGMHMADPISGEFSVGVSGLRIENGELTHPIKGAMISGNLIELMDRIDAVASDLTFYGALGAPTFRVAHLTVA